MKRAVLLWLAACQAGAGDDYPPGGGGGGPIAVGSGGNHSDGGVGDGGGRLTGRVCLIADLRRVGDATACAATGAGGLNVALGIGPSTTAGTRTATTQDDGGFAIDAPMGAGFTWHVTGPVTGTKVIAPSVMLFGTSNTIPVIAAARYSDLVSENGALISDLEGSIVVRVVHRAAAVSAIVASSQAATNPTFYDAAASADVWTTTSTGGFGVAWLPGVTVPAQASPVAVALSQQGTVVASASLPVENQAITFAIQELP
jgi:hypothetical protein